MSGGNFYQQGPGQPNQPPQHGGYPPRQQPGYPPQPGYPQQSAYPQQSSYPPAAGYSPHQPYGNAGYPPQAGGFVPIAHLPTECFGGFWMRFLSYILDSMILAVPGFILGMLVGVTSMAASQSGSAPAQGANLGAQMAVNVASLAMGWLYFALMEVKFGGTLGKLALGLRVVDEHGMYLSFGRASGRYFAKILSSCTLLIGFIIAGFDPQKRALHDRIATTFVLRKEYVHPGQLARP
jgi:uncharacterized RDD family membrane protein YckC